MFKSRFHYSIAPTMFLKQLDVNFSSQTQVQQQDRPSKICCSLCLGNILQNANHHECYAISAFICTTTAKHAEFGMSIDYKHTYKSLLKSGI
jgi:hypothetical protein